jgi:hypothetical protein
MKTFWHWFKIYTLLLDIDDDHKAKGGGHKMIEISLIFVINHILIFNTFMSFMNS